MKTSTFIIWATTFLFSACKESAINEPSLLSKTEWKTESVKNQAAETRIDSLKKTLITATDSSAREILKTQIWAIEEWLKITYGSIFKFGQGGKFTQQIIWDDNHKNLTGSWKYDEASKQLNLLIENKMNVIKQNYHIEYITDNTLSLKPVNTNTIIRLVSKQ